MRSETSSRRALRLRSGTNAHDTGVILSTHEPILQIRAHSTYSHIHGSFNIVSSASSGQKLSALFIHAADRT